MSDIETGIWDELQGEDILVYGIHGGESAKLLADFIEQTGVTFPILADQGTLYQLEFPPGTGYPYPRDVVIDKQGVIRSIKNSFNAAEMKALVQQLLDEPWP